MKRQKNNKAEPADVGINRLETITLTVLARGVAVQCQDKETRALILEAYGQLSGYPRAIDLSYIVGRHRKSFFIAREGRESLVARSRREFLALFDQDLTIELQKLRRDLYFVHAAVVEFASNAFMLVAKSGSGKSTTTWALLHHGLGYASDELGPVDLDTLDVHPFPRALSLKSAPPPPYWLPEKKTDGCGNYYVPTSHLLVDRPAPLAAIFFLRYRPESSAPSLRRISGAEGAARLYANALNPLAHPEDGLDGAIRIASERTCFELLTADLTSTCALVKNTVQALSRSIGGSAMYDRPTYPRLTSAPLHTANPSRQLRR